MTARRRQAVQRILGEIARGVDRGDRIATLIQIQDAHRSGEITDRDADRLIVFLTGVAPGQLPLTRSA